MVEVGGRPILWHIMKNFASFGLKEFVVCTGYKGEMIKEYFLNYEARMNDFTIHLGPQSHVEYFADHDEVDWQVTLADTGATTMSGGRVKRVARHLDGAFMVTYGDGLADVDIDKLLAFHESHGRLATMTTVRPLSRFGVVEIAPDGAVRRFREKPQTEDSINAGFFVFEPGVFAHLQHDTALEREPLEALAAEGELMAYVHGGFFQPMDTYRELTLLNGLWAEGRAPWKVWSE
jgi:glucose-1-phosphate cytidylyltransferase